MASKVDQSSATSSKVSMLRPKFGFVIPKNKLSGSLVRTSKGSTKNGSNSAIEDSTKQSQRKTKFSSCFTPDASVRKRTALAYQTRLDQINKRLKTSGQYTGEEFGDYEPSVSPTQASNTESNKKQLDKVYRELLDLERREIIGELLKLNPSYKAPADYKPLLKEARIPVPMREYGGYNFIRMLLGAESNTQKRLQDETGAKLRVHGAKKGTGDKHEITQADINEAQTTYEDIYINVSAETYDKVDAAVALLEQLLASATSKPASPATQPVVTSSFTSISQFPANSSPWLPPRAPPGPLNSVSVPSSAVQPFQTNSSFQYGSYTGPSPPVRPNSVLMPLSPAGPGPHRPLESAPPRQPPVPFPQVSPNSTPGAPYHAQMRGPPARPGDMHAAPPQPMGPLPPRPPVSPYTPIQAPRMATPSLATSNHPMVRPPGPTSGDFSYQPRQPFHAYHNPGNQFGYRMDPREYAQPPPRHHGFQYPNQQRERMDPYGYPSAPRPGQMMRNWDQPTGRSSYPNRGYGAPPGPRGGQYYDPFMPSSTGPVRPRKERRGEADPEYEDLMASVGVK